jgi:DNA-binding transcriptional regulator YiaG
MSKYHYTECGLPSVWIENINIVTDDAGEETYRIPHINSLHRAIAKAIVSSRVGLTGPELRFLRTEMGLTQAELASFVHKDGQTVGRWERGECPIDENAQTVIRIIANANLKLDGPEASELARFSVTTALTPSIHIDGSNPEEYRLMDAA